MSSKKKRNKAKVVDAKWDATLNPGKEIQLINGGFAIVDEDQFEYFNQWKWFWIEDVGAARFEYHFNGMLGLILLAEEVMGAPRRYVEFEDLDEELKPFAKVEDANVFDPSKYERGREIGFNRPMRRLTIQEDDIKHLDLRVLRIMKHRNGDHIIATCLLPDGELLSILNNYNKRCHLFIEEARQRGFCCLHADSESNCPDGRIGQSEVDTEFEVCDADLPECDALVVVCYPDKMADRSEGFKIAISRGLPIIDVSSDPVRIWNCRKGCWDDFCEKSQMYPAIHQYLTEYWNTGDGGQEEYIAKSTETEAF